MASAIPFIRTQRIWYYRIPQVILFASLCLLFAEYSDEDEYKIILGAALVYYFILYSLQTLIPTDHRKGIALLKKGNYEAAKSSFEKSAKFFEKNQWVDKYRFITMLSASKRSYLEISLCNEAFCLTQMIRGEEAKEIYRDVLIKYPENEIAITVLRTLESVHPPTY